MISDAAKKAAAIAAISATLGGAAATIATRQKEPCQYQAVAGSMGILYVVDSSTGDVVVYFPNQPSRKLTKPPAQ